MPGPVAPTERHVAAPEVQRRLTLPPLGIYVLVKPVRAAVGSAQPNGLYRGLSPRRRGRLRSCSDVSTRCLM